MNCTFAALGFTTLLAFGATAQEPAHRTLVPPGVAAPDTLETRFGTLNLFGGFPDAASVDLLCDNLDFQKTWQPGEIEPVT